MPFFSVIGHSVILRLLESASSTPASSYLFVGPKHVGKRTVAKQFVRRLLDLPFDDANWATHPDLNIVAPIEGKTQISVEQVRDLRDRIALRPSRAPRVVIYVPQADRLNESGTNALLKVVEEPPAGAVFVFVAEDLGKIPGTLQSRSVILPFSRVSKQELVDGLIVRGFSTTDATTLAESARGLPGLALQPDTVTSRGADFVRDFLSARSAGERLMLIEDLTKSCDAEEDGAAAWKETLLQSMQSLDGALVSHPEVAGALGIALISSLRFAGGALSPRIPLEACAARLADDPDGLFADLQPQHVRRAFFELYSS